MKIVIFSPVIESSAIGMVNSLLVIALQKKGHHVTVVRSEVQTYLSYNSRVTTCEIINWNEIDRVNEITTEADLNIYQIGDNYNFHCGCMEWLPIINGIVCLHDYFLGNLFYGMAHLGNYNKVKKILDTLYPEPMSDYFFHASSCLDFIEKTKKECPLTEWVAQRALGVIVHSAWDIQRLVEACPGPVYTQPLPHIKSAPISSLTISQNKESKVKSRIINILTIGHVNPNKRAESVIRAIAQSKNRQRIYYHIAGSIPDSYSDSLYRLADILNVNICIWGSVSEKELTEIIEKSDIITCLRWPALESASASMIEALMNKRPTIVTNTGFYGELPDNVVFKIDPHNEIPELCEKIDYLIDMIQNENTEIVKHVSEAYRWAIETFCIEKYAEALVKLGNSLKNQQSILEITNHFANVLNQWNSDGISKIDLPNLDIFATPNT